jgi:sugar phosphate isomerase/epimerase
MHPTGIAFDIASAQRAPDAVGNHKRFGFNYDPSHLGYRCVDYVKSIHTFGKQIHHAHMKDVWWGHGDGTAGVFGGHTDFCDPRCPCDFRSVGRGDIKFEDVIVDLNDVGYAGPLSVEWGDGRMDHFFGAAESAAYVKKIDFPSNKVAFNTAFDKVAQGK